MPGRDGEIPSKAQAFDKHMVPWVMVLAKGFFGEKGGREGVKLEEVFSYRNRRRALSRVGYEDEFLGRTA